MGEKEEKTESPLVRAGWMLKRKRKRNQGFAKRWLKLTEDGRLSYSVSPKSSAREACIISHAAISRSQSSLDFIIDTGSSIWRIRALSSEDFAQWQECFSAFIKVSSRASFSFDRPAPSPAVTSGNAASTDIRAVLVAATKLGQPLEELESLSNSLKGENETPKDEGGHGINKLDKKFKTMFAFGHNKESSSKSEKEVSPAETASVASSGSQSSQLNQISKLVAQLQREHKDLINLLTSKEKGQLTDEPRSDSPTPHGAMAASRRSSMADDGDSIFYDADTGAEYDLDEARVDDDDEIDELSAVPEASAEEEDSSEDEGSLKTAESGPVSGANEQVNRRTSLPAQPNDSDVSIFGILRKNMGKDLTKISFPISMNEPLSALQAQAEVMEYASLLQSAADSKDPIDRICYVAAFVVSGLSVGKYRGARKPFNPLWGETYETYRSDKGMNFVGEKVSHHPPVMACWAQHPKGLWTLNASAGGKQKFYGKSLEYIPTGDRELKFQDSDVTYSWTLPSTFARNIMSGQKYIEYVGDFSIESSSGAKVELECQEGSMWGGSSSRNKVEGSVYDEHGSEATTLVGKWDESLSRKSGSSSYDLLWKMSEPRSDPSKQYGFSNFAVELNEITSDIKDSLPPTDSRLRPDQRMVEEGQMDEAEEVKNKLEEKQRGRMSELESTLPQYFKKSGSGWEYTGKYSEARKQKKWDDKLAIFDA